MIAPFFISSSNENPQNVLLFFLVKDETNITEWCNDLSDFLKKREIRATIFFTGTVAEQYPESVAIFGEDFDVGSQTYSYVNLTSINDYTTQLKEIRKGKQAVNKAGYLSSKLFRAPFGGTDENIYSLLARSGIVADFSYKDHYNKYIEDKFLLFNISYVDGLNFSSRTQKDFGNNVIISFENSTPVTIIKNQISSFYSSNLRFITASELTGLDLTIWNGDNR